MSTIGRLGCVQIPVRPGGVRGAAARLRAPGSEPESEHGAGYQAVCIGGDRLVRLPKRSLVMAHLISNEEVIAVYAVSRRNVIRRMVRPGCSKSQVYTAGDESRLDQRQRRVQRELATPEIAR